MNKLKEFISKKKRDKKFKGEGHALSGGGPAAPSAASRSTARPAAYQPPASTEERRQKAAAVAEAAARRLNTDQGLTYAQKRLRLQAKRELEEEQRRMEQLSLSPSRTSDNSTKPTPADSDAGVLYTCDLFDEELALPKAEMIEAVEAYLREQLESEAIEAAVIMIFSLNNKAKHDVAIQTLKKYVQNIVDNPTEEKFRKIKMSNKVFQEKVAPVKGSIEYLKALGFVNTLMPLDNGETDEFLVLTAPTPDDVIRLNEGIQTLENGSGMSLKLYRDPKVFIVDPSKPIPKPHIPSDFFELSAAEIKKEQQTRTDEVERMTTLMTSKMREEGRGARQMYKYTLIRIRFPNNFVLQGVFSVHEQFDALREFVCFHLADNFGVFFLTDPVHGGVRIEDGEKSLADYGLAPAAILHFDWDTETSALFSSQGKVPSYLSLEDELLAVPMPL